MSAAPREDLVPRALLEPAVPDPEPARVELRLGRLGLHLGQELLGHEVGVREVHPAVADPIGGARAPVCQSLRG